MTSVSRHTQPSSNKLFGELIKKIRITNNLTQTDFGKLFYPSVTQSTVARWEKGEQNPDRAHFPKIASLLDITFEEFLELIEKPQIDFDSLNIENKTLTHNKRHLSILKKGAKTWNGWREKNPHVIPQLSGISLALGKYSKLDGYNLDRANLAGFSGTVVSFKGASLKQANLEKAKFQECNFKRADLTKANLKNIEVIDSRFERAILREADLNEASIRFSNFIEATLEKASIQNAKLSKVNLAKAILKQANLSKSQLIDIDFREANLNEASLEETTLKDCSVYDVSFFQTNLKNVKIENIYIAPENNQGLPINDLSSTQLIYHRRYNPVLMQKNIDKVDLEKEIISLSSILADKYGDFSHAHGFHIFCNYQDSDYQPPYINVRREGDYFHVILHPDSLNKNLVSSGKNQSRKILQIKNGIIESNFEDRDINIFRNLVQFTEELQTKRVEQLMPITLKILELQKSDKFISDHYIVERINDEIILFNNSEHKIELMRIKLIRKQWKIIRSSLSERHIMKFQKLLLDLLM